MVEQGRVEEESLSRGAFAAVEYDGGPRLGAGIDVACDLVTVGGGDERSHIGLGGPVTHAQGGGALGDLRHELVGDGVDGDDDGDRHAAFTCGTVTGVDGGVGGEVEVRVGQDEHMVLRSAERLTRLPAAVPFS